MADVGIFLGLLFLLPGAASVQWASSSPPDGKVLYVCQGATVLIPWQYLLDAGDYLRDVTWLYNGHSQEMIALLSHSQFVVLPAFAHRVSALENGGISMSNVLVEDSGNFSIEVDVFTDSGASHVLYQRVVFLHVAEDLMTQDGAVHVTQSPEAVLDPRTDQYSIQLQCGVFVFTDSQPFQVEWITPDGHVINSSDYHDHHFTLTLPPPVKGGNYTCRIPPQQDELACLHDNGEHQGEATVFVDKVDAQLSILVRENKALKEQLTNTQNDHNTRLQKLEDATEHQVAFHAINLQASRPATGSPLVFKDTILNHGQAYDPSSGYFTCPYAGTYYFIVTSGAFTNNDGAYFYLKVDDALLGESYTYDDESGRAKFSPVHAAVHLAVGQRVWVQGDGSAYFPTSYTMFTGFLLFHDFP